MSIKGKATAFSGSHSGWLNIYRLESAPKITDTSLHEHLEDAEKKAQFVDATPNDIRFVTRIQVRWKE